MGQALRGVPEGPGVAAAAEGDVEAPPSIGAWLARQRLLRRITLDELEAATRIPRRSLERLEAGAFDRDRDAFARSFVRTVATALGLDPEDAVTRMLAEATPHARGRNVRRLRTGRVVALAGVVLAVAAGIALWRAAPWLHALGGSTPERAIVHRRDAVRALAEETRARRLHPAAAPAAAGPAPAEGAPEGGPAAAAPTR